MAIRPQVRERISQYSSILKFASLIAMIVVPLCFVFMWLFADKLPPYLISRQFGIDNFKIRPLTKILGMVVSLIPAIITFLLFFNTYRLFALYQKGYILLEENVRCFKRIGLLLIINALSKFLVDCLYTVILTMHNGPGHCSLSLGISSDHLTSLASGFFLMIVAWVMDEARKANEELELTI